MRPKTVEIVQEALAIIGLGLFAFGVWQIYPPACFILTGAVLMVPFMRNAWRCK